MDKKCSTGSSCCVPETKSCNSGPKCSTGGCTAPTAIVIDPAASEATPLLMSSSVSASPSQESSGVCLAVSITWLQFARALAFISIIWNVLEGGSSIYAGVTDFQLAVLVYGIQSLIEVISASLVWWRLAHDGASSAATKANLVARERKALRIIGILFIILAAVIVGGAIAEFVHHEGPSDTFLGLLIASIAAFAMLVLYFLKMRASYHLDSRILREDAMCSRYCCQLAILVIIASLINMLQGKIDSVCSLSCCDFWWVDGACATAIALWILRDGVRAVRTSYRKDFDGGCGCCSASESSAKKPSSGTSENASLAVN